MLQRSKTNDSWKVLVGRPCSPVQFLQRAALVSHPASRPTPVPALLSQVVHEVCADLSQVHRNRVQFFHSLCQRARELSAMEAKDHAAMEPSVRSILRGKRLLLFQELLASVGFPDCSLVKDIASGLPLTSWLPSSNHMQPRLCPSQLSKQELLAQSKHRKRSLGIDRTVWRPRLRPGLVGTNFEGCLAGLGAVVRCMPGSFYFWRS